MDWNKFIQDNNKLYFSIAVKSTNDVCEAEDIVQNVYLSLFKNGYKDSDNIRAIGMVSTYNQCVNRYRNRSRRISTVPYSPSVVEYVGYDSEVVSKINYNEVLGEIREILTEEEWDIIYSHAIGFKYREIADRYGLNINTFKSYVRSIRKKICHLEKEIFTD